MRSSAAHAGAHRGSRATRRSNRRARRLEIARPPGCRGREPLELVVAHPRAARLVVVHRAGLTSEAPVHLGQPDESAQLAERVIVVVDADIDDVLVPRSAGSLALDDQHRGRLASPEVAAGGLGRVERCQQPLRQRAGGRRVRLRHSRPDLGAPHHVRLDAEPVAGAVAGLGDAEVARVRGGSGPASRRRRPGGRPAADRLRRVPQARRPASRPMRSSSSASGP